MNDIFTYFLSRDSDDAVIANKRQGYSDWFATTFPKEEFQQEDRIMHFLIGYASRLNVPLRERYLDTFIASELKVLIAKEGIKVSGVESLNVEDVSQLETAYQITRDLLKSEYYRLMQLDSNVNEFVASADAWMSEMLNERLINVYSSGFEMISNMQNKRIGAEDALEYTSQRIAQIQDIFDKEKLEELNSVQSENNEGNFSFVTDTGLPTIDKDMGGAYTSQLLGIEAPPGMGKTRMAAGLWAYRAMVTHKRNVLYFVLEQTREEIEAILVSRHILTLFKKQIPDSTLLKEFDRLSSEQKELVNIAKFDLFESGNYGKIRIETETIYVETFISKMKMADRLHGPFDVFIIDYMSLIEQKGGAFTKPMLEYEIVKKSYKSFKKYVRKFKKFGIAVQQLNRDGATKAAGGKSTGTGDAAGGMEVYRSTDYNIVISATPEEEAQNKRRLSNPKKRGSAGYGSVLVDVRMGCSYFYQNVKDTL